jgi:type I restriction enzyme S subunit
MEKIEEIERLHGEVAYESKALPTASKYDLWKDCENEFEPVSLGECVSSAKNGLYKHKRFHGTGTVLLRMFNIRDGELDPRRLERVQVTAKELSDFEVRNGDLVVSRVNSRELVGKSAVVLGLSEPAINEAMIIRLRVEPKKADSQFLSWLINSPQFLHELRGRAKHAIGQSSINQTDLLSSKIPLPSLPKQQEIVASAIRFLPAVTDLQGEVNPQGEVISHLRDAILRKAFAGELYNP